METSRLSIKGQVVIPARLRKKYGFKHGEKVVFIEEDNYVEKIKLTLKTAFLL